MKASTLLLLVSLGVNVALLGAIAIQLGSHSAEVSTVKAEPPVTPTTTRTAAPGAETWSGLARPDLAAERDRLRAEGFPDQVVRAILSAQIHERYAAQRKAIQGATVQPYWKKANADPTTASALRDLTRAEQKEIRDLLGTDPNNYAAESLKRQIPNLAPEKAEQLLAIQQRYEDQRRELYSNGPLFGADAEKTRDLDKAMHAEFAAVLTPQELEEYDLRSSRTATQLQYTLSAFNPTEDEFRAIYKAQAAYDEQYGPMYTAPTPEESRARMDAQKQLQADIAAALGTDRYAEYQRATDYNYRQTSQLAARLNLPPDTADNLYAVQKEFQQKQQDLYKSARGMTPDDMRQQLTALQQEATARVSTTLNGDQRALEAYKTYGGQWLRYMVPSRGPSSPVGTTNATMIIRGP